MLSRRFHDESGRQVGCQMFVCFFGLVAALAGSSILHMRQLEELRSVGCIENLLRIQGGARPVLPSFAGERFTTLVFYEFDGEIRHRTLFRSSRSDSEHVGLLHRVFSRGGSAP